MIAVGREPSGLSSLDHLRRSAKTGNHFWTVPKLYWGVFFLAWVSADLTLVCGQSDASSAANTENPHRSEWQDEQEWRVVGDIHLAELPFESAFVFVPTTLEARELTSISRFPIMVIPSP